MYVYTCNGDKLLIYALHIQPKPFRGYVLIKHFMVC